MKLRARMSIRGLATKAGVPHSTMSRRVHHLHRTQGGVLVRDVVIGRTMVDTKRFLSLCDDFFGEHVATPSEVEELRVQVSDLRDRIRALTCQLRSLGARLRSVESMTRT